MGKIVEFYDKDMDGNAWENLCNNIYSLKYGDVGYQYIPAGYLGDGGIEGYTKTGIAYQCYYPEKEYTDDALYIKLREKMTTDLKKLYLHEKDLMALGVTCIKEWHFVTPEYRDKRILAHAKKKEKKLIQDKLNGNINIIDKDFKILIKVESHFIPELQMLVKGLKTFKLSLPKIEGIDWTICDSEKSKNIRRKLDNLLKSKNENYDKSKLNELEKIYTESYLEGIKMMMLIKESSPALYERIVSIENSYKKEISRNCALNTEKSLNMDLFTGILSKFENKLEKELGEILDPEGLSDLQNEMIGKWLADCPLQFV